MPLATLILAGRNWFWFCALVIALALLFLLWSYRSSGRGLLGRICLSLKLAGILALAACLLEPLWSGQHARPGANLFAIIADNSQGLQIKDRGQLQTRGELLREMLNPQKGNWQPALEENFDLRRYYFDARLQGTKDFSELNFDGRSTALGATLRA